MKISNETKVGTITAIAITILILGFNYLKGKNLTQRSDELYAVFPDVKGLIASNPVYINGLQVGKVSELKEKDRNMSGIIVTLTLNKDINIPGNSAATINSDLLGSTSLEIILGDSKEYVKTGDTLHSSVKLGMISEMTKSLNPAISNMTKTLNSLDMLIQKLSSFLDPNTKNNLQGTILSLNATSRALEKLISAQSAVLGRSLNNIDVITGAVAKNSDRISNTLENLEKTSSKLANANIEDVLKSMKATMDKLEATAENINSKNGTLGLLLNDRQLFDELRQTNRSLTTLIDDIRMNPKRYVNISVFGKKAKGMPLKNPLYDTTSSK